MKKARTISFIFATVSSIGNYSLASTSRANAYRQAVCEVSAATEAGPLGTTQEVIVNLQQDGRALEGAQAFELFAGGPVDRISIRTWGSKAGQVATNTFNIQGIQLSNAGMNALVKTDSFSFTVECSLK